MADHGNQTRLLQDEREAMLKAAKKSASLGTDGKSIPDSELAEHLSNLQNGQADVEQLQHVSSKLKGRESKHMKSLREGKVPVHKAAREGSGHKRKRKQGQRKQ